MEREGEGQRRDLGHQRGYIHRLDREATTFFFTNFPEEVKAIDLWPRFARFGRVGEVFIPKKVDKQGKRFGFVKYREVKDEIELLRSISNIWVKSFKLRVNLSKFKRQTEKVQQDGTHQGGGVKARQGGGVM
jgi:RNA recognition motif-containing protein